MATSSVAFKSRKYHKKKIELEEARKAGLAPAEVDEDGKEINPHIPQYMSSAPCLKHQKNWKKKKTDPNDTNSKIWYDKGAKIFQAETYRKGSCQNCGAMTHDAKSCPERPRKVGARFTNKNIRADEKVESLKLSYDAKRDRWNGYDPSEYHRVVEFYEAREDARKKYLKEQQIKKLEEKKKNNNDETNDEDDDDGLKVDEAKVDESKQMDFAKVEKRVRTTGGGSTGTVRNLRIREDTAKYLLNLDLNSAHYDPKTRSMREDPLPNADPNEKFYQGDNHYRNSVMQAAPSQAELLYKNFKAAKERLKSQTICERQVEYDRAGRIIKGHELVIVPKSKYEEDVYVNNHTSVWGSWWKDHQWGYKCCQQTIRNSYCTGSAGIEAAESALDLMKANLARKEASEERPKKEELANALKKEDEREKEEKDERKRKYNVKYNNEVTQEEMEAYRVKRVHHEDPMKDFP
ncbi:hypothetical protein EUTSA_v10027112mg [Eutrema salsugineum]|uniref:Pre-mRNA-splicing factor SLU7 n=1 Tax=Eutrema salsugineum TaxID=72664 RepID=V4LZS5_EUTSA|nr:hypothetical protein EUTSA_v10027112mg [Eutrema salsugineum]